MLFFPVSLTMKPILLPAELLLFESLPHFFFGEKIPFFFFISLLLSCGAGRGPGEMTAPAGRSKLTAECLRGRFHFV